METHPTLLASAFDFELPAEAIAQHPSDRRDGSRLLVLDPAGETVDHHVFSDLPELLREGDLLVVNESRVRPLRLYGNRGSGARVEALVLEGPTSGEGEGVHRCLLKTRAKLRAGEEIGFEEGRIRASVREKLSGGVWLLDFGPRDRFDHDLEEVGRAPLPPYIHRSGEGVSRDRLEDRSRYQTVFARVPGSVAAPTAGLHFTEELFGSLESRGVGVAKVTLHVGPGTFRPLRSDRVDEHEMEEEEFEIDRDVIARILEHKRAGGRVVAVGSTSCRTLESLGPPEELDLAVGPQVSDSSQVQFSGPFSSEEAKFRGRTSLFIHPPFQFRWVDAMITNFHLPKSTLLLLVSAFAGREAVLRAYAEAIERGYRFYSFGDAMLIQTGHHHDDEKHKVNLP